jgi:hypothetical protein
MRAMRFRMTTGEETAATAYGGRGVTQQELGLVGEFCCPTNLRPVVEALELDFFTRTLIFNYWGSSKGSAGVTGPRGKLLLPPLYFIPHTVLKYAKASVFDLPTCTDVPVRLGTSHLLSLV